MSIGLISENKIRQKLRNELEDDIKKFLDKGGKITQYDSDKREFKPAFFRKFTIIKQDKKSHV